MNNFFIFSMSVIVSMVLSVTSEVVFNDTFTNDNNWVFLHGECDIVENGTNVTIGESESGSYLKADNAKVKALTSYTYEVDIASDDNNDDGVGIIFGLQEAFSGYIFLVTKTQNYTVFKGVDIGNGSYKFETIASGKNSFINPINNILKVSKKGSTIALFCNDTLLEIFTDSDYGAGSIGLYLGKGESAIFDNATVTDEYEAGHLTTSFRDDFEDNDIYGWGLIAGSINNLTENNGVLKVSSSEQTIIYTSGYYKTAPCTTIVTNTGSDGTKTYGITFMKIIPGQNVVGYNFLICGNRQYFIFENGGSATGHTNSNISGETDTLIVTSDYKFIVNGVVLDSNNFSETVDFNAAGLYIAGNAEVEFRSFSAGDSDVTNIIADNGKKSPNYQKSSYVIGGIGIVYDLQGREVIRFSSENQVNAMNKLASGSYFIYMAGKDKKNYQIHKTTIYAR